MARGRTIQNAFTSGELSPRVMGRTDKEFYAHGARNLKNAVVFKQGGARRREGSRFVHAVKTSAKFTRLVTFTGRDYGIYAGDWVLEIGHLYIRFYNDGVLLEAFGVVEVVTPWTEFMLRNLNFQLVQIDNVMYFTVGQTKPYKLTLTRDAVDFPVWTFAEVLPLDGPYLAANDGAVTLDPSGTSGSVTVVASSPTFLLGHVGSLWRIGYPSGGSTVWGSFRITAFGSTTSVTATIIGAALIADTATTSWAEGSWSDVRGWPVAVTQHQQRLVFGGTNFQPATIWGSYVGLFRPGVDPPTAVTFTPGILDSDPYSFTLDETRSIRWLRGGDRALRVGASNLVAQLQTNDGPIAPTNLPDRTVQSGFGSNDVPPVRAHNSLSFLQVGGRILRQVTYEQSSDSYAAFDMNALADLITGDGIVDMSFQQEPDSVLWACRADGAFLGLTYEPPNNVLAWHHHLTGGDQDLVDGQVEALCVARHSDEKLQVYLIVKRIIGGATARYIERLDREGGFGGRALNVDSAVVYSGVATDTVTGLSHLEGETVDIVGDGMVFPQQTVASGAVTLSQAVEHAEVGLHYDTEIIPVRPEMATGTGTGQGARKRFSKVFVRVHESAGFKVNGNPISVRTPAESFDAPPSLATGDFEVTVGGWSREGDVVIRQDQPLPLSVLAVIGVLSQED